VTEKVFATLASLAGETLVAGHAVILDAVYGDVAQRAAIEAVAQRAKVGFTGIWLEAPEKVLAQRIEGRKGDASDATVQVLRDQAARVTRPDTWFVLDAEQQAEKTAEEIKRRLKS
jgi:predicted kinase